MEEIGDHGLGISSPVHRVVKNLYIYIFINRHFKF